MEPPRATNRSSALVRIGYGMSLLIALWMGVNTLRAFLAPEAFARNFGLGVTSGTDLAFVQVYGLRALFLGAFALFLILRRDARTLGWFALIATIMPVGDALLVAQAAAPPEVIARHAAIAVYLLVTSALLSRAGPASLRDRQAVASP